MLNAYQSIESGSMSRQRQQFSQDDSQSLTPMIKTTPFLLVLIAQHTRHQQGPYCPASTQAAIFGAAVQGGEARNEPDFGNAGGKGSRRKGRDMERALARGDLGALGNEVRNHHLRE